MSYVESILMRRFSGRRGSFERLSGKRNERGKRLMVKHPRQHEQRFFHLDMVSKNEQWRSTLEGAP
jgi:hypothetical protein